MLLRIALFMFCFSFAAHAGGEYWGVGQMSCFKDGTYRKIFVRGKYNKSQGSGAAHQWYIWNQVRKFLETDQTTIPWNCGDAKLTGDHGDNDLTEAESARVLAQRLQYCNQQVENTVCLDKSPWTGVYFGVFDSFTDYGQDGGGQTNGSDNCYARNNFLCTTPEGQALHFMYQVEFKQSDFGIKQCSTLTSTWNRPTDGQRWDHWYKKKMTKRIWEKWATHISKCRRPLSLSLYRTKYFKTREEVEDSTWQSQLNDCSRFSSSHCYVEKRVIIKP